MESPMIYDHKNKKLLTPDEYVEKLYPEQMATRGIDGVYRAINCPDEIIFTDNLDSVYYFDIKNYTLLEFPDAYLMANIDILQYGREVPDWILEQVKKDSRERHPNPLKEMYGKFPESEDWDEKV